MLWHKSNKTEKEKVRLYKIEVTFTKRDGTLEDKTFYVTGEEVREQVMCQLSDSDYTGYCNFSQTTYFDEKACEYERERHYRC